jgi:TolB-like protein/Tfp pilus assembly protein PilF
MKRCPHCRRDYFDDALRFCLDDGTVLVDGPGSGLQATAILPSEQPTRPFQGDIEGTRLKEDNIRAKVDWKIFLIPAGFILIVVAGFFVYQNFINKPSSSIKSLAVLPFENLSGDVNQEFVSDGMTEAIIGNLSQIGQLRVTSRTSAMRYKQSGKSIPEIAKELGVDGIIEGSVQRSNDTLRVTVQLVDGATDSPVWSKRYERRLSDILKLESEIAQAVAGEIKIKLTPAEQKRIGDQKSIDPRAAEAALLGKHYFRKFTADGTKKAVDEFQKAVNIQSDYADAWGGLADAWTASAMNGNLRMSEARQPTKDAAQKALEIDADSAAGHIAMCFYKNNYEFDWAGGEEHCKRGIELAPRNGTAHFAYAFLLSRLERWDEMSAQMEEAMRLDPDEPWWPSVYGDFLVEAGRLEKVSSLFDRAHQMDPRWGDYSVLYRAQGKFDEALKIAEENRNLISAARTYAVMGNRQKAEETLKSANRNDVFGPILVYAALGNKDKAFEMLNRNLDNEDGFMGSYAEYLELGKLMSDPRWKSFLKRMNRV